MLTATQQKATAAGHHHDVAEWSLIADALAPDSIPAEILASAIDPMNALLRDLSVLTGWRTVEITPDIEVTYGSRAYGLLAYRLKIVIRP
ncbi:hypothetical protein [Azotobacter salinestris]|uniref:hypothetical protein n=1 Tax=Azotobacter salinestris TaxID=69964 RepID=UPI0032DE723A